VTGASLTAKFIGVVVTALVVGTAVSLAVVLLLMAVAPWAAGEGDGSTLGDVQAPDESVAEAAAGH
jgi:hypothetical protein